MVNRVRRFYEAGYSARVWMAHTLLGDHVACRGAQCGVDQLNEGQPRGLVHCLACLMTGESSPERVDAWRRAMRAANRRAAIGRKSAPS